MIEQFARPRVIVLHHLPSHVTALKDHLVSNLLADVFATAESSEAMSLLERLVPDLVISSHHPPSVDGISFFRWLTSITTSKPGSLVLLMPEGASLPDDLKGVTLAYDRQNVLCLIPDMDRIVRLVESKHQLDDLHEEITELKDQLPVVATHVKAIFRRMLELKIPWVTPRIEPAAEAAAYLATQAGLPPPEVEEVKMAAYLADVGRLLLPRETSRALISRLDGGGLESVKDVSLYAYEVMTSAYSDDRIAKLLKSQFENFNGTGFPDRRLLNQIPLGSRILRIVSFFRESLDSPDINLSDVELLKEIEEKSSTWFDPELVAAFRAYLEEKANSFWKPEDIVVSLEDLAPGMILAQDLFGPTGNLLLQADNTLTARMVEKLKEMPHLGATGTGITVAKGPPGRGRIVHTFISRSEEKRQLTRHRYSRFVQYRPTQDPARGYKESILRDISVGGILLETYESYPLGTELEIRVLPEVLGYPIEKVDDQHQAAEYVQALGQIRWVRRLTRNRYNVGLQFTDIDPVYLDQVKLLLGRLL
ncbi:MAG: PilZ domain-containing protein [Deltaproteobacteria bacterium]|nr:PilZ domain-containing protein [Deltaproteobacteria bacterium]